MEVDLSSQIKEIISNIQRVEGKLNMNQLDLSRLQWEGYLDHIKVLSLELETLTQSIRPELKYAVTYPTKNETPFRDVGHESLLCFNDIPEVISENAVYQQQYQEKLGELGIAESPAYERESLLQDQIHDHNNLCKLGRDMIQELIRSNKLTERIDNYKPTRKKRDDPYPCLKAIENGDGLPTPFA